MASNEAILEAIKKAIENDPTDPGSYEDYFSCLRTIGEEEERLLIHESMWMRRKIMEGAKASSLSALSPEDRSERISKLYDIHRRGLGYESPEVFDSFMLYVESRRAFKEQFYYPRRRYLLPIVKAYQDVADGKIDILTISLLKRGGKSQTGINFVNWLSGRAPNRSTLMEGTGDDLVISFYKGCLEYLTTPSDYLFYDIFPDAKLVEQNADTKIINLNKKTRFPTIMCRSIDAQQVGLSEATNVLYLDDTVKGRDEARNRGLLDKKWETLSGDVIGRAIEGTPIVATGTRYSLYDPIGRLQEYARDNKLRLKTIEIPALDPVTDESNYEYYNPKLGRMIFTTEFLRTQRKLLSAEQFESEFQQQPFEAKGLMFPEKSLQYYFRLPEDKTPDAVIAICDPAESGTDSTSMGIFKVYGNDIFLDDVVFDNSPALITKPQCAKKIVEHGASVGVFESNSAGEYYARDVEAMVKENGGRCSIRTRRSNSNKQARIEFSSDNIIKNFYFKDKTTYEPNSQYAQFMREVWTYTRSGKVPHDDAPDMLSLAENEVRGLYQNKVEIINRLW